MKQESELAMDVAAPELTKQTGLMPCHGCEELTCPIRQALGEADLTTCSNAVTRMSARAGEKLDVAGFAPDTVFRVVNGMLMQEHVSEDGRRHIAAFKTNGDLSTKPYNRPSSASSPSIQLRAARPALQGC